MKYCIIGAARSGIAAAKLAVKNGNEVFVTEIAPASKYENAIVELQKLKCKYEFGKNSHSALQDCDCVIVSPGVPPDSSILKQAKTLSIPIISELEFAASQLQTTNPIVAITGTNGKTTTTSLIQYILQKNGRKSVVAGNIGAPLSDFVGNISKDTYLVVEVSSYQLEYINTFRPNIAIILNITPDHLSYHGSMENYIKSKFNIAKNQTEKDFLIINVDDKILSEALNNYIAYTNYIANSADSSAISAINSNSTNSVDKSTSDSIKNSNSISSNSIYTNNLKNQIENNNTENNNSISSNSICTNNLKNQIENNNIENNYSISSNSICTNNLKNQIENNNTENNYKNNLKSQILNISLSPVNWGIYVSGEGEKNIKKIIYKKQQKEEEIMQVKELALPGVHNQYNSMAAAIVAKIWQLTNEDIRDSLMQFQGVEHRLEFVQSILGVDYINDSKATNVNAAWYALSSYSRPITWIAGGLGDNNDYSLLDKLVKKNVKSIITIGSEEENIFSHYAGTKSCYKAGELVNAVNIANNIADKGDVVLFSPACKSFDQFLNFEHRGEVFKQAVQAQALA